jgi:hypothetical protein
MQAWSPRPQGSLVAGPELTVTVQAARTRARTHTRAHSRARTSSCHTRTLRTHAFTYERRHAYARTPHTHARARTPGTESIKITRTGSGCIPLKHATVSSSPKPSWDGFMRRLSWAMRAGASWDGDAGAEPTQRPDASEPPVACEGLPVPSEAARAWQSHHRLSQWRQAHARKARTEPQQAEGDYSSVPTLSALSAGNPAGAEASELKTAQQPVTRPFGEQPSKETAAVTVMPPSVPPVLTTVHPTLRPRPRHDAEDYALALALQREVIGLRKSALQHSPGVQHSQHWHSMHVYAGARTATLSVTGTSRVASTQYEYS